MHSPMRPSAGDFALQAENINATNKQGATMLFLATRNGHADTVKRLLNRKANPNITNNENTSSLELAVSRADTILITLLLAGGADPLLENELKQNMLHLSPNSEVAAIFLAFEADTTSVTLKCYTTSSCH